MKNHIGTIIFDFDGTLADTKGYVLEALNQFATANKLSPVHDIADMRSAIIMGGWRLNYRLFSLKATLKKLVLDHIEKNVDSISIQPLLPDCIKYLFTQEFRLGILTTNREQVVQQFLKNHQLEEYFSFIHSSEQKDKALAKLIRQQKISLNNLFYVGDQATDILATKALTRTIAVTWGYESETLLSVPGPSHIVKSGKELAELLADIKEKHLNNKVSLAHAILRAEPIKCASIEEIFSKLTSYPTEKFKLLLSTLANVKKNRLKSLARQFLGVVAYTQLFEPSGVVKAEIISALGGIYEDTDAFRHKLLLNFFKHFILPCSTEGLATRGIENILNPLLDPQKRMNMLKNIPRRLKYFDHHLKNMLINYFYDMSLQNYEKNLLIYSNEENLIEHGFAVLNEIEYMKKNKQADPITLIKCLNTTVKMLKSPTKENCQKCQVLGVKLGHKPFFERLGHMIVELASKIIAKLTTWIPSWFQKPNHSVAESSYSFFQSAEYRPIKYHVDDLVTARVNIHGYHPEEALCIESPNSKPR